MAHLTALELTIAKLEQAGVKYEIIPHGRAIHSARDGEEILGIKRGDAAPNLIALVDGRPVSAIIPGDRWLDFKKLATVAGGQECRLADPGTVERATGSTLGAVPLLTDLPTFIDEELMEKLFVYGGSGDPFQTVKIAPAELLRATGGAVASICRG